MIPTGWAVSSSLALTAVCYAGFGGIWFAAMVAATLIAIIMCVRSTVRSSSDWAAPVVLLIAGWVIRFAIPGSYVALVGSDEVGSKIRLFSRMGLDGSDWRAGYKLATLGLVAVMLGWSLARRSVPTIGPASYAVPPSVRIKALYALVVGLLALLVFVSINAGLFAAITSGSIRTTEIESGSGVFRIAGLTVIAGSVVLMTGRISDRRSRLRSLAPVVVAMAGLWVLGGRSRAVTPLVAAGLLLWYWTRIGGEWRPLTRRRVAIGGAALVVLVFWLGFAGKHYRGNAGIAAPIAATKAFFSADEWTETLLGDFGHLHGTAGAASLKPGEVRGSSFASALLWPASQIVGIEGESRGRYIITGTTGEESFGVHPSLMGDAYLSFGPLGAFVISVLFGYGLGRLYRAFVGGRMHAALYAIVLTYLLRVFFSSIDKWTELVIIFLAAWLLTRLRDRSPVEQRPSLVAA